MSSGRDGRERARCASSGNSVRVPACPFRAALLLVATAACSSGGAPSNRAGGPPLNLATPALELAVADHEDESDPPATRVRFVKLAASGLVVTRTVSVPGIVDAIVWAGREPVVMLDGGSRLGHISAAGYEPFAAVANDRWIVPKPESEPDPKNSDPRAPTGRFDEPRWRMIVDAAGQVWHARCDWGWDLPHGMAHHCVPEGGRCDAWVFARVSPGPMTISHNKPDAIFDSDDREPRFEPLPDVPPSPAIRAELVEVPLTDGGGRRTVLRCADAAGSTSQYPTEEDRDVREPDGDGVHELTWISATPPRFYVTRRIGCLETMRVIFLHGQCVSSVQANGTQPCASALLSPRRHAPYALQSSHRHTDAGDSGVAGGRWASARSSTRAGLDGNYRASAPGSRRTFAYPRG